MTDMEEDKRLLLEYEIELVVNKQLLDEKHITYDVYKKVANSIIKDIEECTKKTEDFATP